MVLSYTFLELGQRYISDGTAWLTPVCVRTSTIDKVAGGWSHLLRLFLEHQLLSTTGLAVAGVPITVDGKPVLIFARLHNILGDGEGLMKAFDWKGASSMKPCAKHFNVLKKVWCPISSQFAEIAAMPHAAWPHPGLRPSRQTV